MAAAVAYGFSAPERRPSAWPSSIFASKRRHEPLVRLEPRVPEALIALLGLEVAGAQHRLIGDPVVDEGTRELARPVERLVVGPWCRQERDERCHVLRGVVGEGQDGVVDVAEVLVEGGRRRAHLAGDVDDLELEHALLGEQLLRCVEQLVPRLRGA